MKINNNKEYKDSPLGKIPIDWEVKKIENVATVEGGYAFDSKKFKDKGVFQIIKMSNLYDNILDLSRSQSFIDEISKQEKEYVLKTGDIIITLTGTVGKRDYGFSFQITDEKNLLLNQRVARIVAQKANSRFLYYEIKSNRFLNQFYFSARGGTGNQTNVGTGDLSALRLILPPLPEQRAIATCLTTIDETITKTNQLIAQKELRKKWLMQQLLTGKKRLKGFDGKWKEYHLGERFSERNETRYFDLPLLSVGALGIYPQSDSIKKDTSNEDKSKYKRICPGDIGYNTMRMWQGRSALSSLEGIVSPAYTIVTPREKADSLFFSYIFKTARLMDLFWRNSQGLVDDTLNCKFKDFAIVKLYLPNKDEQTAIAKILQTSDKEIQLLKAKAEKLKEEKKGMMQVLLTGKKRLHINNMS